jgi:hypothetical protein
MGFVVDKEAEGRSFIPGHMGFVVDKEALRQVLYQVIWDLWWTKKHWG